MSNIVSSECNALLNGAIRIEDNNSKQFGFLQFSISDDTLMTMTGYAFHRIIREGPLSRL